MFQFRLANNAMDLLEQDSFDNLDSLQEQNKERQRGENMRREQQAKQKPESSQLKERIPK